MKPIRTFRNWILNLTVVLLMAVPLLAQQVVYPYQSTDGTPLRGYVVITALTTATLFAAPSGATRNYITTITCNNPATTTGLMLRLTDQTPAAPVTLYEIPCPASNTSEPTLLIPPLKWAAATAVNVGIGTTTVSTQYIITATGFTAR